MRCWKTERKRKDPLSLGQSRHDLMMAGKASHPQEADWEGSGEALCIPFGPIMIALAVAGGGDLRDLVTEESR